MTTDASFRHICRSSKQSDSLCVFCDWRKIPQDNFFLAKQSISIKCARVLWKESLLCFFFIKFLTGDGHDSRYKKFPDPVARFLSIRCNFPLNLQQLKTSQEHNFFCSWAFCWKETEEPIYLSQQVLRNSCN